MTFDPYKALGVDPKASREEIRKAFRRRARECHPDVSEHPNAKEEFQKINLAWEILGNEPSRRAYDEERLAADLEQETSPLETQAKFRFITWMSPDEWALYRKIGNIWEGKEMEGNGEGLRWRVKYQRGDKSNLAAIREYSVYLNGEWIDIHGKETTGLDISTKWVMLMLRELVREMENFSYYLKEVKSGERSMLDIGQVVVLHEEMSEFLTSKKYRRLRDYLERKHGIANPNPIKRECGHFVFNVETEGNIAGAEGAYKRRLREGEGGTSYNAPIARNHYGAPWLGDDLNPPIEVTRELGRDTDGVGIVWG